ncbi:hypothetical protein ACQ4PT_032686 [Festuca glaucescens]
MVCRKEASLAGPASPPALATVTATFSRPTSRNCIHRRRFWKKLPPASFSMRRHRGKADRHCFPCRSRPSPSSSSQLMKQSRNIILLSWIWTREQEKHKTTSVETKQHSPPIPNIKQWSSISFRQPHLVGASLRNMGNTCFLNATLQCLTHTVPLLKKLGCTYHSTPCSYDEDGFCSFCALKEHMVESILRYGSVLMPARFKDNLSDFLPGQQEDAHEFLRCLLDNLHKCTLDPKSKGKPSSIDDESIVKQVFGGRLKSHLKCHECGHLSETFEPFLDLSLEIDQIDNLVAALESFTKVEQIGDAENKLTCGSCNGQVCKDKQLVLDKAPDGVAFQLKRFTTLDGSIVKIDKHVAYPSELDLKPFHTNPDKEDLKYDLYGVVEHSGLPNFGHYVCTIRSLPSSWHLMNDSLVDSITETSALHQEAYMLFYVRQGMFPWFSSLLEEATSGASPMSVLGNTDVVMRCAPSASEITKPDRPSTPPPHPKMMYSANDHNVFAFENLDEYDTPLMLVTEHQTKVRLRFPRTRAHDETGGVQDGILDLNLSLAQQMQEQQQRGLVSVLDLNLSPAQQMQEQQQRGLVGVLDLNLSPAQQMQEQQQRGLVGVLDLNLSPAQQMQEQQQRGLVGVLDLNLSPTEMMQEQLGGLEGVLDRPDEMMQEKLGGLEGVPDRPDEMMQEKLGGLKDFLPGQQEDAHEFLRCLLDNLHKCTLDPKSKGKPSSIDDESIVKQVFGGRLKSHLKCHECGHLSETFEPFLDLSLEIDQIDNLVAALESFTKVEQIGDAENKLTCGSCNGQVCKDKQLVLDKAPDGVAFQLKRFTTLDGSIVKIDKHVAYPSELDLKPFHTNPDKEDLKYDLYGVVEHSGLPNFGHYVCTIRSLPSSWHLMNDSLVDSITETSALHQEAYMLFYVRQGMFPWFSSLLEEATSGASPMSVLGNTDVVMRCAPSASEITKPDRPSTPPPHPKMMYSANDHNVFAFENLDEYDTPLMPVTEHQMKVKKPKVVSVSKSFKGSSLD